MAVMEWFWRLTKKRRFVSAALISSCFILLSLPLINLLESGSFVLPIYRSYRKSNRVTSNNGAKCVGCQQIKSVLRTMRKCVRATPGRMLQMPYISPENFTAGDDEVGLTSLEQARRHKIAIFSGCSVDLWRTDSEATPADGVYRLIDYNSNGSSPCSYATIDGSKRVNSSSSIMESRWQCSASEFSLAFARWRITDVHITLDRADLNTTIASGRSSFADLLRCYVSMLKAVASHDKKIDIYFHVRSRKSSTPNSSMVSDDGKQFAATCQNPFPVEDLEDYSDALLSAAFNYAEVFNKLYGLSGVRLVVHQSQ